MAKQSKGNKSKEQKPGQVDEGDLNKIQQHEFTEVMREAFLEPGKVPGSKPIDDEKVATEALRYDERREEESYRGENER
jgi:hypothetical protein